MLELDKILDTILDLLERSSQILYLLEINC
jgi:hypothetical protein